MKKIRNIKGRKIIAFCLAILLLFVPFSSNLGGRFGANAEEGDPAPDPVPDPPVVEKTAIDKTASFSIPGLSDTKEPIGTPSTGDIYFEALADKEIKVHVLSENVKVNLSASLKFESEDGQQDGNSYEAYFITQEESYTGTILGHDNEMDQDGVYVEVTGNVKYKVTYGYDFYFVPYSETLDATVKDKPADAISSCQLDDTPMALYVAPVVKAITLESVKVKAKNPKYSADDEGYNFTAVRDDLEANGKLKVEDGKSLAVKDWENRSVYNQVAIYNKVVDSSDGVFKWNPSYAHITGEDGVPVYAYAETTGSALGYVSGDTTNDIYVGKIKSSIIKSEDNIPTDPYSDWKDGVKNECSGKGYYCGAARYYANVSGHEQEIETLVELDPIRVETDRPIIDLRGLYEYKAQTSTSPETWTFIANSGGPVDLLMSKNHYSSDKTYRYVVAANSTVSINSVVGYTIENGSVKNTYNFTKGTIHNAESGVDDPIYYYTIKYSDIENGTFQMYIDAIDELGHSYQRYEDHNRLLAPSVKVDDSERLTIKCVAKNGESIVDFNSENNYKNIPIDLYITAESRFKIETLAIYDGENAIHTATPALSDDEEISDTVFKQSQSDDKWKAEWKISLPKEDAFNANYKIENLIVKAKDEFYKSTDYDADAEDAEAQLKLHDISVSFSEYIYDITSAVLDIAGYSDISSTKWYQSFQLEGEIKSGSTSAESYLIDASYAIDPDGVGTNGKSKHSLLDDANNPELPSAFSKGVPSVSFSMNVPSSTSTAGTKIRFFASDVAGNEALVSNEIVICVDSVNPEVKDVSIEMADGVTKNGTSIQSHPKLVATVKDNFTIDRVVFTVTYPNGVEKDFIVEKGVTCPNTEISVEKSLPQDSNLEDGKYKITVVAYDQSGRASYQKKVEYTVDHTKPIFSVSPEAGIKPDAYYTNKDFVRILLSIEDENVDKNKIKVMDGETDISDKVIWFANTASLVIKDEGNHRISLSGTDAVGNVGDAASFAFCLDKTAPTVSHTITGTARNGVYSGPVGVNWSLGDEPNPDPGKYIWTATRTLPSGSTPPVDNCSGLYHQFTEDGEYRVTFYAIDLAGNIGEPDTVTFTIDATKPQATISAPDGLVTKDTTVTFNIKKPMWKGITAKATIYRKAGDGTAEQQYRTFDIPLTGEDTGRSETLNETGEYRIELNVEDNMGNTAEDLKSFTIDKDAPVITVNGVNNYDKLDESFELNIKIDEAFYSTKQVSVKGTRTDITGKVENLDYKDSIAPAQNPTIITHTFNEDGIYELTIYSKDAAGNETSNNIHFTIDKTKPVIGDLSAYDDKVINSFDWNIDLQELVSDLTVCDISVYLNGTEYDGSSALDDGAYTLVVKAVDELGHKSEKTANFVLDTKKPVFIVSGVEDGDIKNGAYKITISLQLAEDTLDSVQLNGKTIMVSENNMVTIDVTEEGQYELVMHAVDAAGNEETKTISFAYGQEKTNSYWLIAAIAGGIVVVGGIIFIILAKRRRRDY